MTPSDRYQQRSSQFDAERVRVLGAARRTSHFRLLSFVIFVILIAVAEDRQSLALAGVALVFLAAFIGLVVRHARQRAAEARLAVMLQLNRHGLLRLDRDWAALPARPARSELRNHAYGEDLDLFGRAALAQLLGETNTPSGRSTLERWLLAAADIPTVQRRQAAVRELAAHIDWRDTLSWCARETADVQPEDLESFVRWAEGPTWLSERRGLRVLGWVLPLVTWTLLLLDIRFATTQAWLASVLLTFVVSVRLLPRVHRIFASAFRREAAFAHYGALLRATLEPTFNSELLVELQGRLGATGESAAHALQQLERIMQLADLRFSSLHQPIQWLTLSDIHVLHALERWQSKHGSRVRTWLATLGELEALAALAALAHDHPDWAFPEILEHSDRLSADALGHPLLAEAQRVNNPVAMGPTGHFVFITGSNMSGKSTLLRAIGMNVVLAQAGAPVCARSFQLPRVELHTAIRVQDSLARGVSYFLAELERLKSIVDAAARPQEDRVVLYLLDEVLHGTNSAERRIAARKVIARLVELGAWGAVTSHDLELVRGGELDGRALSVHFREHFRNVDGQVRMEFDYVLRPGLASTTNALHLLELVGLS
ncbi:MAG: MutS-related protein [Longimicrobiales bacterium]